MHAACRSTRTAVLIVLLVAALLGGLAAAAPAAGAKSYSIGDCTINAGVDRTGALAVDMAMTYTFSGTYHFVYWDVSTAQASKVDIVGVDGPNGALTRAAGNAPGTYSVTDNGSTLRVQANFELTDTSATYTLHYVAHDAAKRWADTSELYWQFVAQDGFSVPMDHFAATVQLPGSATTGEIRAWAHGPLTGVVTIGPGSVVNLAVDPLPAGNMVEVRILFPQAALSGVRASPQPRVAAVLAEEQGWADKANAERAAARDAQRRAARRNRIGMWLGIIVAVGIWIPFLIAYFKVGREYKPSLPGEYYRDLPDPLPAALIDYLWTMGDVSQRAPTATLVDLANRGVVRIEPVSVEQPGLLHSKQQNTYQLTLDPAQVPGLDPIDDGLLRFLFETIAGDATLTIPEMRDYAKKHQREFRAALAAWHKTVTTRAGQMGWLESAGSTAQGCFSGIGVALWVGAILVAVFIKSPWLLLCLPSGVALLVVSRSLKRRSRDAVELYAKYRGLRNYMRDFGRLQEKPPTAVVLWQQYLVLAVIFGIADQVVRDMQVSLPEVVGDPAFQATSWYLFAHDAQGIGSFSSAFTEGFQAAAVAASPSSSGAGGGGGFSGGGGGGGGGVGGGAG